MASSGNTSVRSIRLTRSMKSGQRAAINQIVNFKHKAAALLLAPLLWAQGRHVRRVTPRLPEPVGPRQGVAGECAPLRLLIVGDSSAAGVGAATQAEALAGQLTSLLAQHFHVSWRLIANTGDDVQALMGRLSALPADDFDVALVAVGVNDVTAGTSPKQWRRQVSQLGECLQSRFAVQRLLLTPVPPMHAFPALPQPLRWYLGRQADELNRELYEVAEQATGWELAEPGFPLSAELMASDGFHPGAAAYTLWAEQVALAIRQGTL